ncbi:MAG: hypothetical protein QMC37_02825, partial [Flavobacteriales bacterium]
GHVRVHDVVFTDAPGSGQEVVGLFLSSKLIYTSHKHRRVPIELANIQTAMKTPLKEWCQIITEKSIEKGGYVYAVSEAKVRDFFFPT